MAGMYRRRQTGVGRGTPTRADTRTRNPRNRGCIVIKAKDLAAILLTIPEWEVVIEDMHGEFCHVEIETNTIDPDCVQGYAHLTTGEIVNE